MEKILLNTVELAELLGVSARTINRFVEMGMPFVDIPNCARRFLRESALEWANTHEQQKQRKKQSEQQERKKQKQEAAKNQILELFKTLDKAGRAEVLKALEAERRIER